jgi:hypothetical protein
MEQDIKDATALLRKIRIALEEMPLQENLTTIEANRNPFEFELCCIAKMFVPTIHQKIDEIIKAGKMKEEDPKDVTLVSTHQHGADLIQGEKHIEFKASVISAKSQYKCNFSFNIPAGNSIDERRQKLLSNVLEKTKGGGAIFEIKDQRAKFVKQYKFSSEFLLQYFKHITMTTKTEKYNFGCRQCPKCKSFHRLDEITNMQTAFESDPNSFDAKLLEKKVSSQCK